MEERAAATECRHVNTETEEVKVADNKPLLWGIGMLAVGGLVTLATYTSANPGETYVVMAGLLVVGAINLGRGIYVHVRHGSKIRTRA